MGIGHAAGGPDKAKRQLAGNSGRSEPRARGIHASRDDRQGAGNSLRRLADRRHNHLVGTCVGNHTRCRCEGTRCWVDQHLHRYDRRAASACPQCHPRCGSTCVCGHQPAVASKVVARTTHHYGTSDSGTDVSDIRAAGSLEARAAEVAEHVEADPEVGIRQTHDAARWAVAERTASRADLRGNHWVRWVHRSQHERHAICCAATPLVGVEGHIQPVGCGKARRTEHAPNLVGSRVSQSQLSRTLTVGCSRARQQREGRTVAGGGEAGDIRSRGRCRNRNRADAIHRAVVERVLEENRAQRFGRGGGDRDEPPSEKGDGCDKRSKPHSA